MLEGAIVGAADRGEAEASKELLCEHVCLENEAHGPAAKLAPMHIVDWGEAQEEDALLATCRRWLRTCKDTPFLKRDVLLKKYLGDNVDIEKGRALLCMCNSLVLSKGLLYVSTTPNGEAEGILAFLVPTGQHRKALNGVHCDISYQVQQRTLALTQERFWWLMMVHDCQALVQGCQCCHVFEEQSLRLPCVPPGHMHCWSLSTLTSQVWSEQWSSTSHLVSRTC